MASRSGHSLYVPSAWGSLWFLLPLVILGAFVYRSIHATMRLTPEPPPEFLMVEPGWSEERRRAEEELARAYWDCAVMQVQVRYTFGASLPVEPPREFQLDEARFPRAAASRNRYWQRLRQVWFLPHAWEKKWWWETQWLFGS